MKFNSKHSSLIRFPATAFFLLAMLIFVDRTAADDWPHWRGPDRNDQSSEKGLLKKWPAAGPKQIWLFKNAGLGYAGFSIVGEQLFTMGLEDNLEFALCLNAKTGQELWRTPVVDRAFKNNWGDGPRSTPSVDGDFVYNMFADGTLVCLNKTDGAIVWKVEMQDFGGKTPNWGYAESPLVDGDQVVCTPGGKQGTILALNKRTGEKIWQSVPVTKDMEGEQSAAAQAHYASLLPIEFDGVRQYVQLTEIAVIGVAAADGKLLWQIDWPGRVAVIPSPIFSDGKVYVTSGYNVGSKLIELGTGNSATELWYQKAMQNHHGGVVQIGDYFYGSSDKAFVCQDRESGEMKWAERRIKKGALAYADGLFYHVQEDDGQVLLFSADETRAIAKGAFTLTPQTERRDPKGRIWVHPVISNGKLYLRDQEIIYCYDIKK